VHLIFFASILVAWTGAWVLQLALTDYFEPFGSEWATFLYWFFARICIWVLPAFLILKKHNKELKGVLRTQTFKCALAWGLGIGVVFLALHIAFRIVNGNLSPFGDRSLFVFLTPLFWLQFSRNF
jgi:hypothetical protein